MTDSRLLAKLSGFTGHGVYVAVNVCTYCATVHIRISSGSGTDDSIHINHAISKMDKLILIKHDKVNCDCLAKAKAARNLYRYSGDFTLVNNKIENWK